MSRRQARETACLLVLFIAARCALYAAGLRFNLELGWMFLADLTWLQDSLWEATWYFHAFPPGMNLLTAGLLAFPPSARATLAMAFFWAVGAILMVSLARLLHRVGVGRRLAMGLALAFSLLPQSLFFEELYLYTYPCAALLCLSAELFCRAVEGGRTVQWLVFFLTAAVLAWLRTTFHLMWLGFVVLGSVWLSEPGRRKYVLSGAIAPMALVLSLYAKNWLVFGVFGTTSWSGANLTLTTTARMAPRDRANWVASGRLSPYANVSVFAPPQHYLGSNPGSLPQYPWPGNNALWRPSVRQPNYNHGVFLQVNPVRRKDALEYIRSRPVDYLTTVLRVNVPAFFSGSTHWHPHDRRDTSPHAGHRKVLGRYERVFDRLVHSVPTRGAGLYGLLPLVLAACACAAVKWMRSGARVAGKVTVYCLAQVLYVTGISCLFTAQESSRYRYLVEPLLLVLAVVCLRHCGQWIESRVARQAFGRE